MSKNLKGQLEIMKALNMKPNFSQIAKEFGKDWRTVKKYYEGYQGKPGTRNKSSNLDEHYDEIKMKINLVGATGMSVYQYIFNKDNRIGTYSNFKKYLTKHHLKCNKSSKVHLRFETEPGEQLQFDWKENIKMISKNGEVFEFHIFTATLGYSRLHNFVYSINKSRDDAIRSLISTFRYIGGIPKHLLTDNMRAVVDIDGNKRSINREFYQFVKDMGTELKLCKVRSPQTKGKDESANRFLSWLIPYNHEFEDEADLLNIIQNIRDTVNSTVNQTTNVPPTFLFEKEKEFLLPLPRSVVMDSYLVNSRRVRVSEESLIYFRGSRYSVSPKYINKLVCVKETDGVLYVYFEDVLIATHDINLKSINYAYEHYVEGLKSSMPYKDDQSIEEYAVNNLKRFDNLFV